MHLYHAACLYRFFHTASGAARTTLRPTQCTVRHAVRRRIWHESDDACELLYRTVPCRIRCGKKPYACMYVWENL